RAVALAARALVHPVPLGRRKVLEGVDARTAALLRLREQRLVVRLRRLEAVRTYDGRARIVELAVSPRTVLGLVRGVHAGRLQDTALHLRAHRAVAAEVARVAPEILVGVEVGAREDVARQRLDALW